MHEVSREIDFDVSNTFDTSNEHVFLSLFSFFFLVEHEESGINPSYNDCMHVSVFCFKETQI